MLMEKLIESLPEYVKNFDKKTNQRWESGLSVHYSPTFKKWLCFYGQNHRKAKTCGEGYSVVEAVENFIKLSTKKHGPKKNV